MLACDQYPEQKIQEDSRMAQECFEQAFEEAHQVEKLKQQMQLMEQ